MGDGMGSGKLQLVSCLSVRSLFCLMLTHPFVSNMIKPSTRMIPVLDVIQHNVQVIITLSLTSVIYHVLLPGYSRHPLLHQSSLRCSISPVCTHVIPSQLTPGRHHLLSSWLGRSTRSQGGWIVLESPTALYISLNNITYQPQYQDQPVILLDTYIHIPRCQADFMTLSPTR